MYDMGAFYRAQMQRPEHKNKRIKQFGHRFVEPDFREMLERV